MRSSDDIRSPAILRQSQGWIRASQWQKSGAFSQSGASPEDLLLYMWCPLQLCPKAPADDHVSHQDSGDMKEKGPLGRTNKVSSPQGRRSFLFHGFIWNTYLSQGHNRNSVLHAVDIGHICLVNQQAGAFIWQWKVASLHSLSALGNFRLQGAWICYLFFLWAWSSGRWSGSQMLVYA